MARDVIYARERHQWMSDDIYEIDVIYVSITWLLAQVVVAARKTFYSAIPQNHEQRRNIPANCKTVPGALNSIRTAINKLRQALGDSGDRPKYVGTVAGRGYRLMVAVDVVSSDSSGPVPILSPKAGEKAGARGVPNGDNISQPRISILGDQKPWLSP